MKIILSIIYITLTLLPLHLFSQNNNAKGSEGILLIMGGECTNDFFLSTFASLVGNVESNIVIIPTAMEDELLNSEKDIELLKKPFIDFGFKNIQIVHTRSKIIANSDSLNTLILTADGIWITGGRQWRLTKSYAGTKIVNSLNTLLKQGKVIAGTSAGASIMGDVLVRGDSTDPTLMLGNFQNGFGFINNCAIDQHHLARNRQFDMFELKSKKPDILGLGIDENTGIIVNQNKFRVIGESYVCIYDGTRWSQERDTIYVLDKSKQQFYTLSNGLEYDLTKREVIFKKDRIASDYNEVMINKLTGTYQQIEGLKYGLDLQIKVSYVNSELYFEQSWNKAKYKVEYHYLTTFFRANSRSVFHFNKDESGKYISFLFYQYDTTTWRKK